MSHDSGLKATPITGTVCAQLHHRTIFHIQACRCQWIL